MRQLQVTEDGKLTGMPREPLVPCPTCKRKGTVNDHKFFGKAMSYYNPSTGDSFPQETCQTCNGDGWITPEDAQRIGIKNS